MINQTHTTNQLNDHIIAYTIVSTNISVVNRPSKRLHVALHKALHKALPKLRKSSIKTLHQPPCKALQKLYQSLYKSFAYVVNRACSAQGEGGRGKGGFPKESPPWAQSSKALLTRSTDIVKRLYNCLYIYISIYLHIVLYKALPKVYSLL